MALQSSVSSSSSFSYGFSYDVFLSFRGTDTRYGFTGNFYRALCDRGIHTFFDDRELQGGDEITPSLFNAIEGSRIFIPVFSINYASSSFCLDELVHIMKCSKERGRVVLPVFYGVDPSHVRHQTGSYGEALAEREVRFQDNKEKHEDNMKRLQNWKMALNQAADLSGQHFRISLGNEYEYEFIRKIVDEVSNKINRAPLHVADYPVGLESRLGKVNSLLDVGSDDEVCMVGITGIGGIGKTTLARAIYNLIACHFEGLCFLDDVREKSFKHGLVHLQETLLYETLGKNDIKLGSVNKGIPIIKQRLQRKKVLLILDDVDELKQLQAMAGGLDWFGPGSRVIVTTRDKHLLASHGIERTYEVCGLEREEALELLMWKAFKNNRVDSSYEAVLNCAVTYASGLPLCLEVVGSNLFGKKVDEWKSTLDRYGRIPNKEIQKILKVSFDGLEEDEQRVFLDIACCMKGYELAEVEDILHAHYGYCMKHQLGVLVDKSLIKTQYYVTLHDLIEEMGKEIVRQESPTEPGERSRLWFYKDIVQVLEENKGTSKIKIIYLNFPLSEEKEVEWKGDEFKKMENLKTLIIKSGRFSRGPKHLPSSLRVLEWHKYPLPDIPCSKKLSILKLPKSCVTSFKLPSSLMAKVFFWWSSTAKRLVHMTHLNLDKCQHLTEIPDVSVLPNLEKFSFKGCLNLIEIPDSLWLVIKIRTSLFRRILMNSVDAVRKCSVSRSQTEKHVSARFSQTTFSSPGIYYKQALKSLNARFWWSSTAKRLVHMTHLNLDKCQHLTEIPDVSVLPNLERFSFKRCLNLIAIHDSVGHLNKLKSLDAFRCSKLRRFPPLALPSLQELVLSYCTSLEKFPEILREMENLEQLDLRKTSIKELPSSIENLTGLWDLDVMECEGLRLPNTIFMMPELSLLSVEDCQLPEQNDKTSSMVSSDLDDLRLEGCKLSNEYLPTVLWWFANGTYLNLSRNDFTILPECLKECHNLTFLTLDGCEHLREIRGIPPKLKYLSAKHCRSLTSSCRSNLLNQELHEAGGTNFWLPGTARIPEWFEHQSRGPSISFWFRNKLPYVAVCFAGKSMDEYPHLKPNLIINGCNYRFLKKGSYFDGDGWIYLNRTHLFDLQLHRWDWEFGSEFKEALSKNEWNHVELTLEEALSATESVTLPPARFDDIEMGIHIFKQKSSMEDIQFTNPHKRRKVNCDDDRSLFTCSDRSQPLPTSLLPSPHASLVTPSTSHF